MDVSSLSKITERKERDRDKEEGRKEGEGEKEELRREGGIIQLWNDLLGKGRVSRIQAIAKVWETLASGRSEVTWRRS